MHLGQGRVVPKSGLCPVTEWEPLDPSPQRGRPYTPIQGSSMDCPIEVGWSQGRLGTSAHLQTPGQVHGREASFHACGPLSQCRGQRHEPQVHVPRHMPALGMQASFSGLAQGVETRASYPRPVVRGGQESLTSWVLGPIATVWDVGLMPLGQCRGRGRSLLLVVM